MVDSSEEECESEWQGPSGLVTAVLWEVFAWLPGPDLLRCGAVCSSWRKAASEPSLWRRLLLPNASPASCRAVAEHCETWSWHQEYLRTHSQWDLVSQQTAGRSALTHGALSADGDMLATADHEGNLVLWTLSAGRWSSRWSEDTSARGWRGVRRLQWARGGKLLVCGQMALAHRAELIVLQFDEDYNAHVSMRAGCAGGEGGGAGWAGGPRRVLSVELRRLAASQYVSTVWVNAASQETQSEFAGVRSPVLQIYNEQCTCITHLLVAEVPLDAQVLQCAAEEDQLEVDEGPSSEYFRAMKRSPTASLSTLVCGVCGGAGRAGQCGAVAAWWLGRDKLTPRAQRVEGDLRQRRAARLRERQEAQQAQGDPPEPDEASVRAMCSPPDDLYELGGALLSLALHESQSLVWAYTHGAATCLCLPGLRAVRRVRLPALPGQAGRLGHAQMDVGHCVVAAPLTDGSGGVCVWGGSSGAAGRTLAHRAPPAAALLPARCPGRPTVVVLAGNCIHVWCRRVPCILRTMGQDYS